MKKTLFPIFAILFYCTSYAQYQNFENWTSNTTYKLDDYETPLTEAAHIGSTATYRISDNVSGLYSVKLETVLSNQGDTIFGFFLSGDPDNQVSGQPITLTGAVDSIIGWYKYDLLPGDSATLLCQTYLSSSQTGGGTVYVTGQQLTWKRFAYALYATSGADSMIFAAATGDPLNDFKGKPGSWMQLDDVQIKGASGTMNVENYSFENWTPINWDEPVGWKTSNPYAIGEPTLPVIKTTDNFSGSYALQLNTIANGNGDTIAGLVSNGNFNENGVHGGIPYTSNPIKLELRYKNTIVGTDTAWLSIKFKSGGTEIGAYGGQLTPMNSYTLFSQNINLASTPDTLLIGIFSGENPGSTLYIDDIDFIFPVGITENLAVEKIVSYPNPTINELNLRYTIKINSNINIALKDITGKIINTKNLGIKTPGIHKESFNTSNYASGIYFVEFTAGNEKIVNRFIVK